MNEIGLMDVCAAILPQSSMNWNGDSHAKNVDSLIFFCIQKVLIVDISLKCLITNATKNGQGLSVISSYC